MALIISTEESARKHGPLKFFLQSRRELENSLSLFFISFAGSIFVLPTSLPLLSTLIYLEYRDAIATFYQIIRSHKLVTVMRTWYRKVWTFRGFILKRIFTTNIIWKFHSEFSNITNKNFNKYSENRVFHIKWVMWVVSCFSAVRR
jgi:hypothetical protein